jgi:uncharacterized protein (UPF0371 family)
LREKFILRSRIKVKTAFDNEKYITEQSAEIIERAKRFNDKLYLEFGGKLLYDYHAARVLPGYDPNIKMRLLQKLKDRADLILCIYAGDIERKKMRADFGITYDSEALKLIDDLRSWGIDVLAVVITRYNGQPSARQFKNKLERRGINVFTHQFTKGYPTDLDLIVSDEGYGANPYIETGKPLVIVTGPGPGSGKLATCLSQVYHEHKRGVNAGYAKFETFPIWNLPLNHPVNIAYEATVRAAEKNKGNEGIYCGAAIELKDGTIVTGSNSTYLHAASGLILNAIKHLAEIPDKIKILSPNITESVRNLKTGILKEKNLNLDLLETLIALSISATHNPAAQLAMEKLNELRDCEVHMTHIPTPGDEAGLRRLGVNLTSDPNFSSKDLFIS